MQYAGASTLLKLLNEKNIDYPRNLKDNQEI